MVNKNDKSIAAGDILRPSWYINQMKGWTLPSYFLLFFGIGLLIGETVAVKPLGGPVLAFITLLAGILGFTCTVSITNTKPLNGVFGLVSALLYIWVAFTAKNYNDIILQTTYIVLLDIPVLVMPGWAKNVDDHIKKLNVKGDFAKTVAHWLGVLFFFLVVLTLLYYWEANFSNSPRPLVDSIAATIGITGALLTTLRFRESYFFWTAQGIMSVILWGITAMQCDANWVLFSTYLLYLANDAIAFFDKKSAWFHVKPNQNVK